MEKANLHKTNGDAPAPADGRVLLHTCCAPCSVACVDSLRAEGLAPTAFWFNPNIHPFTEYRARRDTLRAYAADIGLPLVERGRVRPEAVPCGRGQRGGRALPAVLRHAP